MTPKTDPRPAQLRERLGAARVDAMLAAATAVGRTALSGEEDLVFGFLQRVLIHLKNHDQNFGLLYPKRDADYRRMFDYFDNDGRVVVVYPGNEGPEQLAVDPAWTRRIECGHPDYDFHEVVEGAETAIVLAFLEVYAHMKERAD